MEQAASTPRHYLVALDGAVAEAVRQLPSRGAVPWEVAADLDAVVVALEAAGGDAAPALVVVCVADSRSLAPADLRRVLHASGSVRLAVASGELVEGEERRLVYAGANCVLSTPLPPVGVGALWRDSRYLDVLFHGDIPGPRTEEHHLTVPTGKEYIPPVIRFFCERFDRLGYPPDLVRSTMPLVLDEAVTNAMEHGNRWDPAKDVHIVASVGSEGFRFAITDGGEGFTRDRVESPLEERNLTRTGGRGLFLMESLMDEVFYEDEGRTIVLAKSLAGERPAGAARPA